MVRIFNGLGIFGVLFALICIGIAFTDRTGMAFSFGAGAGSILFSAALFFAIAKALEHLENVDRNIAKLVASAMPPKQPAMDTTAPNTGRRSIFEI